jgi:hypothetical protein
MEGTSIRCAAGKLDKDLSGAWEFLNMGLVINGIDCRVDSWEGKARNERRLVVVVI